MISALASSRYPVRCLYYVMAENGVGGRALEWAMRLFGYGDDSGWLDATQSLPPLR